MVKGFIALKRTRRGIGIKEGAVRHAEKLAAGIEGVRFRERRLEISLGVVDDQTGKTLPELCKKGRRKLTVVIHNIEPLPLRRLRKLRKEILPHGIVPTGNITADGLDGITEKGGEQKSTDLPLLNQIAQGIAAAVERQGAFVQQREPVAFQLQIAADFPEVVQHRTFL